MRQKKVFKTIKVDADVYDRIIQDRNDFQETIGGGTWSISDTLREYFKILGSLKPKYLNSNSKKK